MRSHGTIARWCRQLLPTASACAHLAGQRFLLSWLLGFTVELGRRARQPARPGGAKPPRQYLSRWLDQRAWDPETIYTQLTRRTRRVLLRGRRVLLLIDTTCLATGWVVLQVS